MSSIDLAFVKAFAEQGRPRSGAAIAEESPSAGPPADAERKTVAANPTHSDAPHYYLEPTHQAMGKPHASFASAAPTADIAPPRPPRGPSIAALEVPRFAWPNIVERLEQAIRDDLHRLAVNLVLGSRQDRKVVLVTGSRRGEGRTTLVMALGRAIAEQGAQVVLVEADLLRPQLADRLEVRAQVGWRELLSGGQATADVLVESVADHVTLLPATRGFASPELPRGEPRVRSALRDLREHFNVVLVDAGPLAGGAAGESFLLETLAPAADQAFVVRDRRWTNREHSETVGRRLEAAGVARWDLVENFLPR